MQDGYFTKSIDQVFTKRNIDNAMNPKGIVVRESRDSEEHPKSLAIIVALDVTGSMGMVPHELVKDGLPNMVSKMIEGGVEDPQILFTAIGDHKCDQAPLQVGQFESGDKELDGWLTDVYLEGNGGGNGGESYFLAWYFASRHTATDCWDKRKEKGFLFTIGDEPVHRIVPASALKEIMGGGEFQEMTANQLLKEASERYNVYHLHITQTYNGRRQEVADGWRELMGNNLVIVESADSVSQTISSIILNNAGTSGMATEIKPETEEIL